MADLPGILFDRESIRIFAANDRPAVYWLRKYDGTLVYFGATTSLRTRLLAHLRSGKQADVAVVQFCRSTTLMARLELAESKVHNSPELCGRVRRNPVWAARRVN